MPQSANVKSQNIPGFKKGPGPWKHSHVQGLPLPGIVVGLLMLLKAFPVCSLGDDFC